MVGAMVRGLFGYRNRRGRGWSVPDWLPFERLEFNGNTGAHVVGRWFPTSDARGMVVLVHPDRRYGQHWFVQAGWIDWLKGQGFHALTFDLPGYGESRGVATYFHEDVLAAVDEARRRAPGLPLHVIGLSIGAYAVANASPDLGEVESITLESPYPNFNSWYGRGPGRWGMWLFDALFPRTSRRIQAPKNLGASKAKRILVAATTDDRVTPIALSRAVAQGGPASRTRWLEVDGVEHLDLFAASEDYRTAIREVLDGPVGIRVVPPNAAKPSAKVQASMPA